VLPLMDGGLGGTLATQVELPEDERLARRFVLDATRPRSNFHFWPLTLLPRLSGPFLQMSSLRVTLGAMVDAERKVLQKTHRPETPVLIARVTGSRRDERPPGGNALQNQLYHLRKRTDGMFHWWPLPGRARDAVLAGYVAAFDAAEPNADNEAAGACLDEVKELRALLREKPVGRAYPRFEQRSGHVLAVLCTVLTMAMVAMSLTPERPSDSYPVSKDIAEVHPFFAEKPAGQPMVVAHEGYQRHADPTPAISLTDFQAAVEQGVHYMETDLGLRSSSDTESNGPEIVALHKGSGATEGAATVSEMLALPNTRWFFELNSAELIGELVDVVGPEEWENRICLTFGSIMIQEDVRRIVEAVKSDMVDGSAPPGAATPNPCTCASQLERWRAGDLPLTRRAVQLATRPMYLQDEVDCVVVSDLTIDSGDVASAGENVMVLSWPTGGEDEHRLMDVALTGVQGIMTDEPELLKKVLAEVAQG
jgi:hypothetical protein